MTQLHDESTLIPGVHRAIRALAPGEGPWAGRLVANGDVSVVWCDPVADDGIDWRFVGAEHIAAPIDIARTADGHGLLLPWCTVRVGTFLAQRVEAGAPLAPGEWVTLVVSLLRGLREILITAEDAVSGQWWLTHDGRPLCVPGGERSARDSAIEIFAQAGKMCGERTLRRIIIGVHEAVAEAMPTSARVDRWERELFDFAAPRALRTDVHAPQAVQNPSVVDLRAPSVVQRRRELRRHTTLQVTVRDHFIGWRERLPAPRRKSPRPRRTSRRPSASRTRLAIVAVGAVVAVLAVGLLWPTDDDPPAVAADSGSDASADGGLSGAVTHAAATAGEVPGGVLSPAHSGPEALSQSDAPPPSEGALQALPGLLTALGECAFLADDLCKEALATGSTVLIDDVLRLDAVGEPTLVDDYGDLAVLRVGTRDKKTEQMIVLVRQDEKWLVRDAYDVADQPESG